MECELTIAVLKKARACMHALKWPKFLPQSLAAADNKPSIVTSDSLDPGAGANSDDAEDEDEDEDEDEEVYRNPIMDPLTTPLNFEALTLARSRPRLSYIYRHWTVESEE